MGTALGRDTTDASAASRTAEPHFALLFRQAPLQRVDGRQHVDRLLSTPASGSPCSSIRLRAVLML